MAIVTFSLDDLKALGLSKEDVKNAVDRLGMSIEGMDETEVAIDITPNRPDMLHITGFAKAVEYLLGKKVPKEKFYSVSRDSLLKVNVTGAVKRIQPYIAVAVIKNVDLQGSRLKNLVNFTEKFCDTYGRRRKKLSMGIYDFDHVSGQLTYDAESDAQFIPLGMTEKIGIQKILKEHPKGKEYSGILGNAKKYPILRDSKGVLALIPIVNSENTKVTEKTKNILVDITANSRYAAENAMNLVACTFMDMGADVYPCQIIYKNKTVVTPELAYKQIKIKKSKAELTLGFWLQDNKIINLVNKLGHVGAKYGNYTIVYVPPYRLDVMNVQDVIEDIAIAYGYENIAPMPIVGSSIGKQDYLTDYMNRASRFMVGLGFSEAMNTYLTNEQLNFEKMGHKYEEKSIITVAYAKTEAITMLRTQIMPWLMENLEKSVHESMPQRLFEIGKVFHLENDNVVEETSIAMISEHSRVNFSEMKAVVTQFLKFAGIENYKLEELTDSALIAGRAAKILVGKETVGYFGEVHPRILENFKLEEPVVAAEININKLLKARD